MEEKPTTATKDNPINLFPPEGDKDVGLRVFGVLAEIVKDKEALGLPKKWTRFYELAKNRHWKGSSDKVSLVSVNLLFAHRQRTVNLLTDNNPTFNVARMGPEEEGPEQEQYDKMLRTAEHWWIEQEQQSVLEESASNSEMYGCTIEKVFYNPDKEYPLGEVETLVVDPFYFGWYPVRCKDIQKAEAVLHYYPITVREARRLWPDSADQIKADHEILKDLGDERREVQAGKSSAASRGLFSSIAGAIVSLINPAGQTTEASEEVLVVECWCKDYSTDEKGDYIYPGQIRRIQTCNAGRVILADEANPSINPDLGEQAANTYLFDKYPFSLCVSVKDTANAWGMSDYEQLESLQREVDKTITQFTHWKDRASRIIIKNPKTSGVNNSEFTNAIGVINPTDAMISEAIKYMDPPPVPSDLQTTLQLYKDLFFLVAGTFELEAAQTPGREVIAYKAIAALLERASTMLKGKIRGISKLTRERGRMYISCAQNWYDENHWFSYEDETGQKSFAITGKELLIPAKLTVVSGSTMPISKVQQREEAIDLFSKGAIDNEEVLKRLEWPDRKNVLKRMMQGPLSALIDKLGILGAPEQITGYIQQLSQIETKDLDKMIKTGKVPSFQDLLMQMMGQPDQAQGMEQAKVSTEIEKIRAEIRKIEADTQLLVEKAETEKVTRGVSAAGVKFDDEKLKLERAKAVHDMEQSRTQTALEVAGKQQEEVNKEKEREHGEKVRKEQIAHEDKVRKEELSHETEIEKMRTEAKEKGTEPYRERGLKSNNQEKGKK